MYQKVVCYSRIQTSDVIAELVINKKRF